MTPYRSHFWKKAPFVKLLLAMIAGILLQWYSSFHPAAWRIILVSGSAILFCIFFIPFFNRYRFAFVNGIVSTILFFSFGALLTWQKDTRNDPGWFGHSYIPEDGIIVTLEEPSVEKTRSFKAIATTDHLLQKKEVSEVRGRLIVYFSKDSSLQLDYGSRILFKKILQEIKNAGNPGGFDYKRYALFQGITHQVFLKPGDFEVLPDKKIKRFKEFIYNSREKLLTILRTNIRSNKERGLAEALLIGYKNDLEQSLVQSYTNTGVVHIIAISGLHLGLIYWLLALLLRPLQKRKKIPWLRPLLIISGLWLFSLLAGAQPSILRSALMFTCIVLGESLSRKTSVYNTMAVSAFILLCINPFWLWDVGFQLSYAAVLSIIIFMKPIYNWFYIKNKVLDFLWKMNAVTLAAQVLTVPLSIYHFHQFPNLFILTNFLAVPLSSVILLGEIFLCIISVIPVLALLTGRALTWLIRLMNVYIEKIEAIPYSLWDSLQISLLQAILLLLFIIGVSYWLMERSAKALNWGLFSLCCFAALRSLSFIQSEDQRKIVVYNVPQKRAIDIMDGRHYFFVGDSSLLSEYFSHNFHLKPSRIAHRVEDTQTMDELFHDKNYLDFRGKHILLLDEVITFPQQSTKPVIDLLILSKNPKLYLKKIAASLDIKQVVFDGSVPAWKSRYWKTDCDSLGIPSHDVTLKGAFVMNLR